MAVEDAVGCWEQWLKVLLVDLYRMSCNTKCPILARSEVKAIVPQVTTQIQLRTSRDALAHVRDWGDVGDRYEAAKWREVLKELTLLKERKMSLQPIGNQNTEVTEVVSFCVSESTESGFQVKLCISGRYRAVTWSKIWPAPPWFS